MKLRIQIVDAFTNSAFAGNPAGVCVLDAPLADETMQLIAREINAAETAFLVQAADVYELRWFTPLVEIDLCGHATLASAHVLWSELRVGADQMIRFSTKSGQLTAVRLADGWIQLDFPAIPSETATNPGLAAAIGAAPIAVAMTHHTIIAELDSEAAVRELRPDFGAILALGVHGVIATATGSGNYDFVSRFFAPAVGINEDPVTGSAHCALGPYWQKRLGKDSFFAYQASPRGGELRVNISGKRVLLDGQALTTIVGEIST